MSRDVFVAGVGMILFTKPGANEPYPQMSAKVTHETFRPLVEQFRRDSSILREVVYCGDG